MKSTSGKAWLIALAVVLALLAVLRAAGAVDYWHRYLAALLTGSTEPAAQMQPRMVIKGGEGGAVPVASPEVEGLYPQAVSDAVSAAKKQGASALVVHRHGHRVTAYFANGKDGSTLLAGGQLSPALMMLATGALADSRQVDFDQAIATVKAASSSPRWRNPWSAAARSQFSLSAPPAVLTKDLEGSLANTLSLRIWQPLQAGDAFLWGTDDSHVRLDCCVAARLDDWMRVGDLLLRQGEYEGSRIVSVDWMRRVMAIDENGKSHPVWMATAGALAGDEPPAAHETFWFDLQPGVRLWLLPRRGLSILVWAADAQQARDTTIPNLLIRGLVEQSVAPGANTNISDIVPGH
ncbi:MAG: hypothetical protein ABI616_06955 [Pseudomonadota bacterium]